MIIIKREYEAPSGCGGLDYKEEHRVFADDDIEGVQAFLNERGYGWRHIVFDYKKL